MSEKSNTSNKRKRKKYALPELSWTTMNLDHLTHIMFFDFFQSYNRIKVTRRFLKVIRNIPDTGRTSTLLNNYNAWKRTREAKAYWLQRETKTSSGISTNVNDVGNNSNSTTNASSVITESVILGNPGESTSGSSSDESSIVQIEQALAASVTNIEYDTFLNDCE
jgi:hypothetical protein